MDIKIRSLKYAASGDEILNANKLGFNRYDKKELMDRFGPVRCAKEYS